MIEPAISGSPDELSGQGPVIGTLLTPEEKIDYMYHAAIRTESKVDWCVQTVNAATQALGNMPFGGGLLKKMGASNG